MISFYMHNSQKAKHAIKWRGKNINLDQTRKNLKRLQVFPDFTHFALWTSCTPLVQDMYFSTDNAKVTNPVLFLGGMEEKENSRIQG